MAKTKTFKTNQDVTAFVNAVPDERKRKDSFKLIEIMSGITGKSLTCLGPLLSALVIIITNTKPVMKGCSYGGFSPRKSAITLYTATDFRERKIY
jgi:hypothetical protein